MEQTNNTPIGGPIVAWGDGPCKDLDRFDPTPDTDALPENEIDWWEQAREPWCVTIEPLRRDREMDIVRTLDTAPAVAGYVS